METELQAKHQTKNKIKRVIKRLTFKLKNTVNTIIFNAVIYKLNIITKSRSKAVKMRHNQKLYKLRRKNDDCSSVNDVSKVLVIVQRIYRQLFVHVQVVDIFSYKT